jgi:hypothetical protein
MARKRFAVAPTGAASRFTNKALETLSGARTITPAEVELYNAMNFDPGGAGRTVTLPPEESSAGVFLMICNEADAAEILTIQNDAAGTIVTPTQNEAAIVWCDGVNWYGLVGATS